MQRFSTNNALEVRNYQTDSGPAEIYGYAAVFHRDGDSSTEYRPVPGVIERISSTAFDQSLQSGRDIVATYDHDSARVLGRTSNGTLALTKDERGLRFSIPYQSGDPDHNLVAGKISRGLVTGSSFSFSMVGLPAEAEEIRHEQNNTVRVLHQVELHELGPVSMPAYIGSDAAVRCADGWAGCRAALTREQRFRELTLRMRGS